MRRLNYPKCVPESAVCPRRLDGSGKRRVERRESAVIHRVRSNWKDVRVRLGQRESAEAPVKVGTVKNSEGE